MQGESMPSPLDGSGFSAYHIVGPPPSPLPYCRKCIRNMLRQSKHLTFPGGAYPQTPLVNVRYVRIVSATPTLAIHFYSTT